MGERKVQNYYIGQDFDPAKIPRRKEHKKQQPSRTMLSMSIRCNTCGNYIGAGTKFNSRKEVVTGEDYLGIKMYWFYSKCTKCSAEFIIKTDLQNSDYTVESGATRNFEPWRAEKRELDDLEKRKNAEEFGDPYKSLENRMRASKREMDVDADIDQVRSIKARHAKVSVDAMLEAVQNNAKKLKDKQLELEAQDEELVKSIFRRKEVVSRIYDDDDQPESCEPERRNVLEECRKPTSSLTNHRFRKPCGGEELNLSKLISTPSRVKISVIKKPGKM